MEDLKKEAKKLFASLIAVSCYRAAVSFVTSNMTWFDCALMIIMLKHRKNKYKYRSFTLFHCVSRSKISEFKCVATLRVIGFFDTFYTNDDQRRF